ncbi:MAG: preprotein translocase subunit SecE [Bacteroidales bacterium]|nr:preprotein translocase subunit SecE [Bacteroidales bacterium]
MNKFILYLKDVFKELTQKVTWPKWSELQASAVIVMVASVIIALLVFVLDFAFSGLMKMVYSLF